MAELGVGGISAGCEGGSSVGPRGVIGGEGIISAARPNARWGGRGIAKKEM